VVTGPNDAVCGYSSPFVVAHIGQVHVGGEIAILVTQIDNACCAFTCPSRTCYVSFSKMNKGDEKAKFTCSQFTKEREQLGMIDFELDPLIEMGFQSFKILRVQPTNKTGI
jgi:hypothetical protein